MEVAQECLDALSANGVADLATVATEDEYCLVWTDDGVGRLRYCVTSILEPETVIAALPIPVPHPPRPAEVSGWHPSLRYYRRSQVSEDLADSLRNLWLAVENLLDASWPQGVGESEHRWVKRALGEAEAVVDLQPHVPVGSQKSALNAALDYYYVALRHPVFHAKESRGRAVPFDVPSHGEMTEKHERLTQLYLALLRALTGLHRPAFGVYPSVVNEIDFGFDHDVLAHVTDDPSPLDPAVDRPSPRGRPVITGTAPRTRSLEQRGRQIVLATIRSRDLVALDAVRRVTFTSTGEVMCCATVERELRPNEVGWFEVQMALRLQNTYMPRSFSPY